MSSTEDEVEDIDEEYLYDEEYEEEEEEAEEEDLESIYDPEDFINYPFLSENSTISPDILEFDFLYGYNCRKYYNLAVPSPETIVFSSGNFLVVFDVEKKRISELKRSALGGGIGHVVTNPNPEFSHLSVAYNGNDPIIIIYEWPSMEINCVLRNGSTKTFTNMCYSPDGMLLASQSGDPDYLITIFNWPKHRILLRTKSNVNDVHHVRFSPYVPGQLTTAGIAHIKFWKMCETFTGLKLKGDLGRFGKTEYSDILGILPMPDEKVVSGSSWGNLLVWDAGLIKIEVMRTLRRKLHEGPITQIEYTEGELWTVSMDGHIKVWWYEKIEQADPPDDDRVIQLEPSYDFYTPGVMLMCVKKKNSEPTDTWHYAQDGNGGIWSIDLTVDEKPRDSVLLYKCHAGPIVDVATSPKYEYVATLGQDGRLYVYNYNRRIMVFNYEFPAKGACMEWLNATVRETGDELILAFDDGNVRVCVLEMDHTDGTIQKLTVVQIIKPHNKPIKVMSVNKSGSLLVTGAEDKTIFVFALVNTQNVETLLLQPIGFIPTPSVPTCMTWHPQIDYIILVGCREGYFFEATLPLAPQNYTGVSFKLKVVPRLKRFTTYKAQIRRDIKIAEIEARKAKKVERKRTEMMKIKEENPGLEIDEDVFLADSESEEELEPLHIPDVPNDILWIQYTSEHTLWLSLKGYDAGYIYEYTMSQKQETPIRYKMVDDADDIEISSFIYNYNKKYLFFAMQDGQIRINVVKHDWRNLSDYWMWSLHENLNGFIPKMCFSHDERYFFSCGHDGNLFSMRWHPHQRDFKPKGVDIKPRLEMALVVPVEDKKPYETLCLEESKTKAEQDRILKLANEHKAALKKKITLLTQRFSLILVKNLRLPKSQIIPQNHLEVDTRVTEYIKMVLEKKVALVRRKLAHDVSRADVTSRKLKKYFTSNLDLFPITVKGFQIPLSVSILRQRRLNPIFFDMQATVEMRIKDADEKSRPIGRPPPPPKPKVIKKAKQKDDIEFFLLNLSQVAVNNKMDPKLIRLLYKYRQRKAKWEQRQDEWEEFKAREPPIGVNHPDDIKDLTQALDTIGDYKLKTSPDYKVPKHLRESTLKKYKQLLESTKQLFAMRHNFSRKVYAIRARKMEVRNALKEDAEKLAKIHAELPKNLIREGPANPPIEDSEYPEKNLMTRIAAKVPNTLSIATDFLPQEENIIFVEAPDADQAEKEVLVIQDMESNCQDIFKDSKLCEQIKGVCVYDMDQLMEESRKDVTLWELEVRGFRLNRKLFEQQEIIQNMQDLIEEFDDELEKLTRERCEVSVDALFLDIFLNSLHQELVILKDFESVEEDLSDKLNQRQTQVLDMQDMIDSIKMQIEAQSASIEKLQDQGKIIQDTFNKSIHDNKFQDFLRRVFKKKYKPPKGARGDESSSESSSSSSSDESDEDEAKSIDSRDFGIIKQDLNVCPKGCDPDIYNLTISLRTQRHSLEMAVKECQRQIEVLKKDMEICFKKLKIMNNNLKQSTEELEAFQREKQQKLNEVLCTIVLHLSQMQHIKPPENYNCNIKDTLVFSKTMLSRLYRRVGELEAETLRQQSKHKINVKHLSRMKTDCNYMEREVRKLQTEIKNLTFIKFGKNISIMEVEEMMLKRTFGDDVINTLQEAVLKKLIHNLRLNLLDIKSMYIQEIKNLNEKIVTTGKELTQTYKVNTGKLELLSLLKKERCELSIEISRQDERREHMNSKNDIATQYKNELDKFTNIIKDQRQEIAELKAEIKMLRTKGLPPKEVILDEVPKRVRPKKSADQKVDSAGEDSSAEMMEPPPPDKGPKKLEKITIPTESLFERQKSEQIVHDALDDLLEKLDIQLSQVSTKSFIMSILNKVVNKVSMEALVEEIIDNLPILPTDEQKSIIEETADKLLTEEEMMEELEEEEKMLYFKTIFDDILEDVYEECIAEPHVFIMKIMLRLVDEILIEDLMKSRSLVEKIIDELLDNIDLTKLNMVKMKESLDSLMDDTLKEFLGEVIRRVFSRGTDYIYWHDL